jgi:hypothetical protein
VRERRVTAGVAVGLLVLGVGVIAGGVLDADESQHLHAAWLISQGRVPYADFWEHHSPLLHYALAPVTVWFADRPAVYFAGRAIMGLAAAGALAVVVVLGRRLGQRVGLSAAMLLAVELRFIQHSTQVRPDGPALLTGLATLLMLVRWREGASTTALCAAGFWLGVTAALTPKAALLGLGAIGVVLAARWGDLSRVLRDLGSLGAGATFPLAALLAWLAWSGGEPALRGFWRDVVVANLEFPDYVKQAPIGAEGAGFAVLAIAGIAMVVRRHGWGTLRHPLHGPLVIPAAVTSLVLVWPSTPAVYAYTWLPVVAVASLYAGLAFAGAIRGQWGSTEGRRRALGALAIAGAVALPAAVVAVFAVSHRGGNRAEIRRMERELAYACPDEAIIDSRPLGLFRRTALRYPSLVLGLRIWIARGVIPGESLARDLRAARAPVGLLDGRLRKIDGAVASFIAEHYVEEPDGLLLAGASLVLPSGDGEADVDVLVPGLYRVELSPGSRVRIDGSQVAPRMSLSAGRHTVSWMGAAPGALRLLIAPCAERRSVGATTAVPRQVRG